MNLSTDRRVLAAFCFRDAVTRATVTSALAVNAPGLQLVRNRSGVYSITNAPGLETLANTFDVTGTAVPPSTTVTISVKDPAGQYLPRMASLTLPVVPGTPAAGNPISVGVQDVTLYPGPAAPARATWAQVFVSVTSDAASAPGLPWVLLQFQQDGATALMTSITDTRGEALLPIPVAGIHANTSGAAGAAVISSETDFTITAIFDPQTPGQDAGFVPDPDAMLARIADPSMKRGTGKVKARSGSSVKCSIPIKLT